MTPSAQQPRRDAHVCFLPRVSRSPFALLLVATSLAAACGQSSSSTSTSTPTATQPSAAPAPAASGLHVFATDETQGNVVVLDAGSGEVVERIPVGKRPRGVHVSADGALLYVALSGSPIAGPPTGRSEVKLPPPDRSADGIGVVDLKSHKLLRTMQSGQDPESFDISPDGKTAYVSNEDAAEMTVLDIAAGTITKRVKVGEEPEGVRVRPDGKVVYVTCEGANEVVAIDTATYAVLAHMKMGGRPRGIEFTRDSRWAFVTNESGSSVTVVDATAHKTAGTMAIAMVDVPKSATAEASQAAALPMGLVLSPDDTRLYVTLGRAQAVAVIDVASRRVLQTITGVGARPWGIGISPDGATLFTANGRSEDVSVISTATGAVERRLKTGGSPWGIAVLAESRAK
ncbi:MAG: beta-propeller fold lactonase family protein [Vicinamibacterales bacterium]